MYIDLSKGIKMNTKTLSNQWIFTKKKKNDRIIFDWMGGENWISWKAETRAKKMHKRDLTKKYQKLEQKKCIYFAVLKRAFFRSIIWINQKKLLQSLFSFRQSGRIKCTCFTPFPNVASYMWFTKILDFPFKWLQRISSVFKVRAKIFRKTLNV